MEGSAFYFRLLISIFFVPCAPSLSFESWNSELALAVLIFDSSVESYNYLFSVQKNFSLPALGKCHFHFPLIEKLLHASVFHMK